MVTTELARQPDKRDALRAELMRLEKSILRAIMTNYPTSGPQAGEQGPLARARRELFVVRVGLAREAARGKNLGQDTAGQPALAAHLDALSQVAELFDQRGRSVRDSETPRAAPRTALAVLEALADLAGEVALSGRGRAATHRSWTTGATTALATPLTRPYTPLWALWRIIGRDGTITAAALSAQFDGRDHRLSWWSDTLATWHRLGALTDAGTGAYRVAPPLRALWVAVGPRIRAAARANVTALPGGSALDPLTGDRLDPTDPATAAAYAELTRLLDAAALARRWWRDGWVDDARATLTRWRDARGHRAGRVDAYPSPDRPGALSRTGRAAAEVGTIAWTRWHAAYTHRQRLRRLVNQALVATRERRRLVRAVAPGPIAPNQLAPILRASQIEADAYGALAHGYVAAHTALTSADAYPHVTERTLRRARAALDSGPGSDPTKLSVAQRLRQIRHELRTATRVLNRAAWPSTEDRDNALRAAALALERAQLAQDDAFRTKLHQTVGGWRRMEAARRATDALWLTYQNELALGGPPTSPIVPARTGIIPPSDDPVDEAAAQAPGAAALTRRGRDHHRNQDAAGVAGTPTRTDAVLTDGLSNTAASERAAYRGAATGLAALTHQPTLDPVTAIRHAYRAAATAITAGRVGAATWLAARVVRDRPGEAVLSYGWVGDSRAYWLPAPGTGAPELLTTDHAVVYNPFGARADTDALTRWLAPYYRPELATDTRRVTGPGLLVLVTDGVWGQLAEPSRLAEALSPTAYTDPTLAATELADAARDRDPDDDTTVVVIRVDGDPGR
jgi:serine/threonine protein phosphatase PrpC